MACGVGVGCRTLSARLKPQGSRLNFGFSFVKDDGSPKLLPASSKGRAGKGPEEKPKAPNPSLPRKLSPATAAGYGGPCPVNLAMMGFGLWAEVRGLGMLQSSCDVARSSAKSGLWVRRLSPIQVSLAESPLHASIGRFELRSPERYNLRLEAVSPEVCNASL